MLPAVEASSALPPHECPRVAPQARSTASRDHALRIGHGVCRARRGRADRACSSTRSSTAPGPRSASSGSRSSGTRRGMRSRTSSARSTSSSGRSTSTAFAVLFAGADRDRDRALPERARAHAGCAVSSGRWSRCSRRSRASSSGSGASSCSGPIVHEQLGPWLNDAFGWTPFFATPPVSGSTMFTAVLVLTIMIVPITRLDQPRPVRARSRRTSRRERSASASPAGRWSGV